MSGGVSPELAGLAVRAQVIAAEKLVAAGAVVRGGEAVRLWAVTAAMGVGEVPCPQLVGSGLLGKVLVEAGDLGLGGEGVAGLAVGAGDSLALGEVEGRQAASEAERVEAGEDPATPTAAGA